MSEPAALQQVSISSISANDKWALNGGPFGSKLVSKMYVEAGVPVIRGTNLPLDKRFADDGFVFVSEDKANELRAHIAKAGDVIFTQRGTLGQVGIIPPTAKHTHYVISQSQMKLTVDPKRANPLYIYYAFRTPSISASFVGLASTSGVPHVNLQTLRDFKIPLPTLEAQHRIVEILGTYDDLIEANRRRVAILEKMAQRLFEEWFVRFRFPGHEYVPLNDTPNGTLPDGWKWLRIGDVTGYVNRGIAPKYDEGAKTLVIGQKCIRDKRLSLLLARKQSKKVPPDKVVRPGDILINSTGVGTLGRVAQAEAVPSGLTVDSHVTLVRPSSEADRDYLGMHLLKMQPVFERLGAGSTGQTELARGAIEDQVVTWPQSDLRSRYGHLVRPMRELTDQLMEHNQRLATSRDLLLPRLMSGQLSALVAKKELEAV